MRFCFLFAVGFLAAINVAEARDIKIASWNLEHLAATNGKGCEPRTTEDYALARKYADELNADVIAFQEVESAKAAARVFTADKYRIEISTQKLRAGYVCDNKDPNSNKSTKQLTGFAIRKDIAYRRNADFKAIDVSKNKSLRDAVDITLLGKAPIRLLAVHLKASCPSQDLSGERDACQTLLKQQPILEEKWIEERYRENQRFIVLGDFNRQLLREKDEFWSLTNDGEPAGLKLAALSGTNEPICDKKYPRRIDHIVVDGEAQKLFESDSFQVLTYSGDKRPSDHCPIAATFQLP